MQSADSDFQNGRSLSDGDLLPDLTQIFDVLGGDSWTVYRFLIQHHPELEEDTTLLALQRAKVEKVLAAANLGFV